MPSSDEPSEKSQRPLLLASQRDPVVHDHHRSVWFCHQSVTAMWTPRGVIHMRRLWRWWVGLPDARRVAFALVPIVVFLAWYAQQSPGWP